MQVANPQDETVEIEAVPEPEGEDVLIRHLNRFADLLGDEPTFEIVVRWRCERSGHEFEVAVSDNQPDVVLCARCRQEWAVG